MTNYTIVGIDNRLLTIDPEVQQPVYTFTRQDSFGDGGLAVNIYEIDPTTGVLVTGVPILSVPSNDYTSQSDNLLTLVGGKSYVIQPNADSFPSEVSWVLKDDNGVIVQSLSGNNLEQTSGIPNAFSEYNSANWQDYAFTCPNVDMKTYEWKRGTVSVSSTATYRLVADDTDNVITVTVTEDNGTVTTDSTSIIISLADARSNGYTTSQGSAVGYTVAEMKAGGYTAAEMKAGGYTVAEMKAGGYTLAEMKAGGYTAAEMKAGGYTLAEMKAGGYTVAEMKAGGYTVAEMKAGGYTLAEMKAGGYTAAEMKAGGYTLAEMKAGGYTVAEMKAGGYTAAEMKAGGYTVAEMKAGGYTVAEMKAGGYTVAEMKAGGYTVAEMKAGGYTAREMLSVNFDTNEILANFDAIIWEQLGEDIDGEAAGDNSGYSVSMNSAGTKVAIGAKKNDGNNNNNNNNSGHVRVYEYNDGTSQWGQLGEDIDGEAAGDNSGYSVSMNSAGTKMAIGAVHNDDNRGHVRVYEYNDGTSQWEQLGEDIDGEVGGSWSGDKSGWSVSMNSDGTIVAIGAPLNDGNGYNSGHVRVYEYNDETSQWGQLGEDIDGEAGDDYSGRSVSMNSAGTKVAIGADYNYGNGSNSGHVRVYEYNDGTSQWEQKGDDIDGEAAGDNSGKSVSMNSAGTIVAIGAPYNDGNGSNSGHVRVYEYNDETSQWGQLGEDIDGEVSGSWSGDKSGCSVSMNSAGTQVAIGADWNYGNGSSSGHVRVYEYNDETSQWGQLGEDIDGEAAGDSSGKSVSMNSAGTKVAIGAEYNNGNNSYSGHVRVYEQVTLQSMIDAAASSAGIDFYFEGLASTLTLNEAIEFLDVDFQSSTLEDLPQVEITLTDPQRIQLNKMFVVELAEDTHIDQATSTLTDEVYESSVTGYQTDETKMPHMGTDLSLATQSLKNNGHRVSPTTHGEASVKFMQRNMDTDTIANSFVSDLIHQAILFRFVENELSNEEYLVDEIEDFLEGTETYHLSGILNQKLIDSKTDETQPHSLAYASFHTLVKSITDSANAQQNKRLTNDPINGMFRNANKVGYVDENNQGDDNAYYMEFLAGDHFIFKLTLNPSATPVAPVYANGQVPSQQPRSLFIKLKIE